MLCIFYFWLSCETNEQIFWQPKQPGLNVSNGDVCTRATRLYEHSSSTCYAYVDIVEDVLQLLILFMRSSSLVEFKIRIPIECRWAIRMPIPIPDYIYG